MATEQHITSMDIAQRGRFALEVSCDFDENVEQTPHLIFSEILFSLLSVLNFLVERAAIFLVANLDWMVITFMVFLAEVCVQMRHWLSSHLNGRIMCSRIPLHSFRSFTSLSHALNCVASSRCSALTRISLLYVSASAVRN
jgi:hypothetical protein